MGRLSRLVDWMVRITGSKTFFCLVQLLLLAWILLGIPFSQTALWPILIGNGQAIFSYILDTMLMRQQLAGFALGLHDVAVLRSRNASKLRMVQSLDLNPASMSAQSAVSDELDTAVPSRSRFARVLARTALAMGHISSVGVFCIAMVVWFAFGPSTGWSNLWQLDLNSALSAWMVFLFSLLAVVREEDADCTKVIVQQVERVDCLIEQRLRTLTHDETPNSGMLIVLTRPNVVQRIINVYAHIVGGLVGLVILIAAFVVWAAIGPIMQFNDNWWLLIGTYAGLIGMNDGFVLRNVQQELNNVNLRQMQEVLREDEELLQALLSKDPTLTSPLEPVAQPPITLTQRISDAVCAYTAHRLSVVAGALTIVGLLIGATAMHWSLTGQLLCNIPPMLLESFFTQILITGHLAGEKSRGESWHRIYSQRLAILSLLQRIQP